MTEEPRAVDTQKVVAPSGVPKLQEVDSPFLYYWAPVLALVGGVIIAALESDGRWIIGGVVLMFILLFAGELSEDTTPENGSPYP